MREYRSLAGVASGDSRGASVSPGRRPLTASLSAATPIDPTAGGGAPLPSALRERCEAVAGADLGDVRVHAGAAAADATSAVQARAYASGQDIVVGAGEQPGSAGYDRLIAHEVAHTVQQRGGAASPQMKRSVSQPGDAHEAEADRFADAVIDGGGPMALSRAEPALQRWMNAELVHGAVDYVQAASPAQLTTIVGQLERAAHEVHQSPHDMVRLTLGTMTFMVGPDGGVDGPWLGSVCAGDLHELLVLARGRVDHATAPPGSIDAAVPEGIDVRGARVSAHLPAGLMLSSNGDRDIVTRTETTVTLEITPTQVRIGFSPSLYIDAMFLADNMTLGSLTYDFQTAATSVALDSVGGGLTDQTARARTSIIDTIRSCFAGTPVATAGYDPTRDPDLAATGMAILHNIASLPPEPGTTSEADLDDVTQISAAVTVAATAQIDRDLGDGAAVRVLPGLPISIGMQLSGSAGAIAGATGPQAQADAAGFQSARLASHAILLLSGGEPVAELRQVTIARGGAVTVGDVELVGSARTPELIEMFVRWGLIAADLHDRGAPPALAAELAARDPDVRPEIVPGIARSIIEGGIHDAVLALIAQYPTIGGVDVARALGVR